jgi:hypothetical protein
VAGGIAGDHPGERPHPERRLGSSDLNGDRFQATLTDLTGDRVEIERLDRGRGGAESSIRGKAQRLEKPSFHEFALNAVWLAFSPIAQDLIARTQRPCLHGELVISEPEAVRYRPPHTPPAVPRSRPPRDPASLRPAGPSAEQLATVFARLREP